uniref:Replication-associated protein n=1 Tax=Circoviridae sp. TaxID=1954248 RepID=A0A6M3YNK2_9VIRU|nr:MAG: replication-associated protein [Circoviridae sp.]
MAAKLQRVCFTWNNYTEDDYRRITELFRRMHNEGDLAYAIIGKEVGDSGTPHLQGYFNTGRTKRRGFAYVKETIFNNRGVHFEKANGSDHQNKEYCSKGEDFCEFGECQSPGKRNDLEECTKSILQGKRVSEVAIEHPVQFVKYHRGLHALADMYTAKKPRDFKTEVIVLVGPPGSGKSRYCAAEAAKCGTVYYKPRGEWWDGYEQHDAVVIDDFYGWIKYDELLKICDRYPYQVAVKGGYRQFVSKKIFITSNEPVEKWYKFNGYTTAALNRRFEVYCDQYIPEPCNDLTDEEIQELLNIFD